MVAFKHEVSINFLFSIILFGLLISQNVFCADPVKDCENLNNQFSQVKFMKENTSVMKLKNNSDCVDPEQGSTLSNSRKIDISKKPRKIRDGEVFEDYGFKEASPK